MDDRVVHRSRDYRDILLPAVLVGLPNNLIAASASGLDFASIADFSIS